MLLSRFLGVCVADNDTAEARALGLPKGYSGLGLTGGRAIRSIIRSDEWRSRRVGPEPRKDYFADAPRWLVAEACWSILGAKGRLWVIL